MKYRKKPVVIDAWHAIEGGVLPDGVQIRQVADDNPIGDSETIWQVYDYLHDTWVTFEWGDWLVKGIRGEFYPVKDQVFRETYEAAEAETVILHD